MSEHGWNIDRLRAMHGCAHEHPPGSFRDLCVAWWNEDIKGDVWYAFAYFSWVLFTIYEVLSASGAVPCP